MDFFNGVLAMKRHFEIDIMDIQDERRLFDVPYASGSPGLNNPKYRRYTTTTLATSDDSSSALPTNDALIFNGSPIIIMFLR